MRNIGQDLIGGEIIRTVAQARVAKTGARMGRVLSCCRRRPALGLLCTVENGPAISSRSRLLSVWGA
eukprot:6070259-Pyramimonas_sp.AAC.1